MEEARLETVLRRDHIVVVAVLGAIVALAWSYVLWLAADMNMGGMDMGGMDMSGMDMSGFRMIPNGMGIMVAALAPWSGMEFGFVFAMWAVMMVGMMTPSAAPMILTYARVGRQAKIADKPFAATGWFAAGYLLVWVGFALIATVVQWRLDRTALLGSMMVSVSDKLNGIVLILAGIYQWTWLKAACLEKCQSPVLFIQQYGGFRRDLAGCLLLGLRHGAYCLGCCWLLMALLFVGGVMNLLWIVLLSLLILLEKLFPFGRFPQVIGVTLITNGVWWLILECGCYPWT